MEAKQLTKVSKYLSFVLRHNPQAIDLKLDTQGWGDIETLIDNTSEFSITRELLDLVVETNDKQRFAISDDGTKIRANQGHSISIDLALQPTIPPDILLHGTAERFWPSIQEQGLLKGSRHHVHLTETQAVAKAVGARYGKPVLLEIDASAMNKVGFSFYRTANGVWLTDFVPADYLKRFYSISN